jgi:hypothetical protein
MKSSCRELDSFDAYFESLFPSQRATGECWKTEITAPRRIVSRIAWAATPAHVRSLVSSLGFFLLYCLFSVWSCTCARCACCFFLCCSVCIKTPEAPRFGRTDNQSSINVFSLLLQQDNLARQPIGNESLRIAANHLLRQVCSNARCES